MTHKDLTPTQRKRINRIIRYFRNDERYNGVTSVRVEISKTYAYAISLVVRTRRSDCERSSPRAVYSERYTHFIITRRGEVTVCHSRRGVDDDQEHVAYMLNAVLKTRDGKTRRPRAEGMRKIQRKLAKA